MNITLGEIQSSAAALRKLVEADMPVKVSYRLGRLVKEVDSELAGYEKERVKLVTKFGKDDGKGNINVTEDNVTEFVQAMSLLNAIEVELKYEPLEIDALGDIKMSPLEMLQLDRFLV